MSTNGPMGKFSVPVLVGAATLAGIFAGATPAAGQGASGEVYRNARWKLVDDELIPSGISHEGVLRVFRETPRHEFVPQAERPRAYFDMALPIGHRQTISSPYIVAYMTECLDPQPTDRVLEIGTGSGFQAAILSPLVKDVYSIEIVEPLGRRAERTLKRLGYHNIHVKIGDGYLGWPEKAPFDKIIVTCSPEKVPQPLIDQLREGGVMIVPVGERYQQILYRFTKAEGSLREESLVSTLFVPMTGKALGNRAETAKGPVELTNLDFEEPEEKGSALPGWYYLRQVARVEAEDAPSGQAYARFQNETPGRSCHALQGFALDGKAYRELKLSASIRTREVQFGPEPHMRAAVVVSFFDHRRAPIGDVWLGPWDGTREWSHFSRTLRVPSRSAEAILRIGLFGATGELGVDRVQLEPLSR